MHVQLHLTTSHVFINCILSEYMSITVSYYQDPCILHLHPTISHVCNNCIRPFPMSLTSSHICKFVPTSMHVLHQASIHICYSNIQPSVLSAALATDQRSSNGCYNCYRQAGLYQPAVKMLMNICSNQIPYSGVVFCVDTLHSISSFCYKFYPSIQLKVHGRGLMDKIPRTKTKHYHYEK